MDDENKILMETLEKNRRKTFLVLCLERLGFHFWRLGLWVLLFLSLWLLEIPQATGYYGQVACLISFIAGFAVLTYRDILSFSLPKRSTINKRIEKSSHFKKGQISSLEDNLANPYKKTTRELWNAAQKNALRDINDIKIPKAKPFLIHKDPRAIRFAIILLFCSACLVAGSDWKNRISAGFTPISPNFILSSGRNIDLWIIPPEYTKLPQLHLAGIGKLKEPLEIPERSRLKFRMFSSLGKFAPPHLFLGEEKIQMEYLGENLYGLEIEAKNADRILIKQLLITRVNWEYNYIIDQPPFITFDIKNKEENQDNTPLEKDDPEGSAKSNMPPEKEQNESAENLENKTPYEILPTYQIRVPFVVKDDYAVTDMTMHLTLDPMINEKPRGREFTEKRIIMSPPDTELKVQPIYDLTWHTWAGLPVELNFEVKDHVDQTAKSETIKLTLPEREFKHPVAKLLIAMRKKIAWSQGNDFNEISAELEALLQTPELYHNDIVAYLAIKTASARLVYTSRKDTNNIEQTAIDIIDLLWETAISIEDGNLTLAMRNLRQSQRDLENALRDPNTTEEEINRLMQNLRQDMLEYFTELSREMQKRMQDGQEFPQLDPNNFADMINPETFADMLDKLESDLLSGDKDAAKELLSQLQNMLDFMDPQMASPVPEDMQMQMKGINELQQLIERQEELLKQTHEQAELQKFLEGTSKGFAKPLPSNKEIIDELGLSDIPPPPSELKQQESKVPQSKEEQDTKIQEQSESVELAKEELKEEFLNTAPNKAEQQALRFILGELMMEATEKLPDLPESMALAELEMRGSEDKLGLNNPNGSIPHQEKAIEYLRQAQEELQQQLQQRMQQMVGLGFGSNQKYDPLGRPYGGEEQNNGNPHGSSVQIPDEAEKKQIEKILKELRRRSGELDRPTEERDYYRRLLRQF